MGGLCYNTFLCFLRSVIMKTNEAQFYEVLENLFIGVKIEDQPESLLDSSPRAMKNGMINLMKAKSQYYHHKKQN
ncbi:methylase domain protein [Helicobacter pylori Hp P-13]|nr:methylase domain protein [Helicobacter pylori Hp P-13]